MPEIRYYEVEQTRTVKVQANNEVDAAMIATEAFDGDLAQVNFPDGRVARVLGDIVVTNININRER